MRRSLSALALSTVYVVTLSACATAPRAETLMAGISPADAAKPIAPGQFRAETDPVCVSFYENARTYITEANKPNPGGNFLKAVGISVLAGVATGGIASSGISSTVGQIAAQQATSTAIYQGSNMALQGMNKKSGPAAKVVKAAESLGCPVNFN